MDYRKIQNIDLRGKSKKEIIEYLSDILGEYGLALEYDALNEYLPPEQMEIINNAIEADTRAFAEEDERDIDEEEILEWINEDKHGRRFSFSRNENGNLVLSDIDARMQEFPEVATMNFEKCDIDKVLGLVRNSITYTMANWYGSKELSQFGTELTLIDKQLGNFSTNLADLETLKRNAERGEISNNLLFEVMRLTKVGISVNELEPLVNSNAASIVTMLRTAEAKQRFKADEHFSESEIEEIRAGYVNRGIYTVEMNPHGNNFVLETIAPEMPMLEFDRDKMATPEFRETIMGIVERGKDSVDFPFSGYYGEKLEEIIELAVNSRDLNDKGTNINSFVEKIAQDPLVARISSEAQEMFEGVLEISSSEKDDIQGKKEQERMEM